MGLDKAFKDIFASKNLHENLSKINGVWYFIGDTIDYSKETCTHAVRLSDYSLSLWLETYDQMSTN